MSLQFGVNYMICNTISFSEGKDFVALSLSFDVI